MPDIDAAGPFGCRAPGVLARLAWRAATARLSGQWRRRLRKRFANRFAGPFDVAAEGVKLRVYPAENRCDRTVLGRGVLPEAAERALIRPLLEPGMTFVDVGANVGVYSLYVSAQTGGTARVVALEPHPRTFAKLDFNCRINGFDRISRINAGAAGSTREETLYFDGGGNVGSASLLAAVGGRRPAASVRLRPLCDILAAEQVETIDLLKIDVEGYEDQALVPFLDAAPDRLLPRRILLETVHSSLWRDDLFAALAARGYREAARTDENGLYERDLADAAGQARRPALGVGGSATPAA